ncbi:complex 1 protein-domain-containing protein [Kockiozyma suomiensis]|uniref:complex 1 protein-domain-containing protein n=1 Tax=Kockiozyma suomiensis TaxID=1337062 RepID=UPI0033443358
MVVARKGRLTGLQRDVLSLYRSCLRAIRKKPPDSRQNFLLFTREQFEQHRHILKSDFTTVEYLLRRGHNQLETYSNAGVRNIGV